MPRVDQMTLEGRKERVFLTLRRHPSGLAESELEQMTSIQRRTLNNYLRDLETEGKVYKDGVAWLALPYDQVELRKFDLTPEEAMALYLATRLFVKQHDKRNEPAETALTKLAAVLTADAGVGNEIHQAALELGRRPDDGNYNQIFRAVMRGYIYRHVLRIIYEPAGRPPFETDFAPYLLEPSAIGFTTYAIGHSSKVNALRTYKLERMRAAAVTRTEYTIPKDFDGLDILRSAWSIIYGEELTKVTLRFSPAVRRRVLETRWHPSEEKKDDPEKPGHLLWTAEVADTIDMMPWIRGWGADVEVMGPEELREELKGEVRRMTGIYSIPQPQQDATIIHVLRLWGKTVKDSLYPDDFHPALFHMVDVGNVARELLSERGSPRLRRALANALNADAENLAGWVPYFVALHDIGKLSAAFQASNKDQFARLRHEGFTLDKMDIHHAHITQICLEGMLKGVFGASASKVPQVLCESLGGHHGRFAHPDQDIKPARAKLSAEHDEWKSFRETAVATLESELLGHDLKRLAEPDNISAAIMAFTGFAILCDWLGSDERYFRTEPKMDLAGYLAISRERAAHAVRESGLLSKACSHAPTQVESLFQDLVPLRSLQLAIDEIPDELLQSSSLTIIEAPTGEGKTEAALTLAHRIARITGTDELYYALPTMATSNQMFERLQTHLRNRLELSTSVKLVHGQAFLIEEDLRAASIDPLENGEDKPKANEAVSWFNSKKRALIAPFGVGTVDQAELAALNVKHAALRMLGLVGKVVLVDEVHAYDTYMTTVIVRLLTWLANMGTSVIMLSATLPKSRRAQLAKAYGVSLELNDEQSNAYPSLLVVSEKGVYQSSPAVWQPNRTIELRELHVGDDAAPAKAKWLLDAIVNGGCACWITNTVKRAQRIFDTLRETAPPDVDLQLLHSQFPLDERQLREDDLRNKYGRRGKRPAKGIVVGTQVLEQSLDLDFDVMVSDLAPIDLTLQRAGRLHRHDRVRPDAHATPKLWLNFDVMPSGDLKLGTDRTIYDEYVMRLTHQTLARRVRVQLPNDYRALIEAVYSDTPPSEDSPLYDTWMELQSKQDIAASEAQERLLPEPSRRDSFAKSAAMQYQFKEDENGVDWITARTRLGKRTLNVIPIEREGGFAILADTGERIPVQAEASRQTQRRLLRRNLRISNQIAIDTIQEEAEKDPTELFTDSALLKGFYPLWLANHKKDFKTERGRLKITLDPLLGLVIEKEGKGNGQDE